MPEIVVRKYAVTVEEIFHEGGPAASVPLKRGAALAVIANPYAGRYVEDIQGFMDDLKPFGLAMARRLLAAMGVRGCQFLAAPLQFGLDLGALVGKLLATVGGHLLGLLEHGSGASLGVRDSLLGLRAGIRSDLGRRAFGGSGDHGCLLGGVAEQGQRILACLLEPSGGRRHRLFGCRPVLGDFAGELFAQLTVLRRFRAHGISLSLGFGAKLVSQVLSLREDLVGLSGQLTPSRLGGRTHSGIEHP